ncbi:MAG: DUF2442 domain-containing protein [Nitrospira sp.]
MSFRVVDARHVHDFVLWLKFSDGAEGELDLRGELDGFIFEPLQNIELFKQFRIDPDLHTLVWPNGADFSPEFLHANIRVTASRP